MMVAAQQMITGGIILSLVGLAMGEASTFDAHQSLDAFARGVRRI